MIYTKIMEAPALNIREICRYARLRGETDGYQSLIDECLAEAADLLSYRVCYTVLDTVYADGAMFMGDIPADCETIKKAIGDSQKILLFAATIGAPFDRLIQRYAAVSPSKAMIFDAVGSERIESLCDSFCEGFDKELRQSGGLLTRRVSPGYGDIPLDMQREIFAVLDCPRKIGLTLNESLIMSPSKSVTAIAGITSRASDEDHGKCDSCGKTNCDYRR